MKHTYSSCPTGRETVAGLCYLAFQMLCLPLILTWINSHLHHPLNDAELNFVFYLVNFIAVLLIFLSVEKVIDKEQAEIKARREEQV